jgi:hypothetical protein
VTYPWGRSNSKGIDTRLFTWLRKSRIDQALKDFLLIELQLTCPTSPSNSSASPNEKLQKPEQHVEVTEFYGINRITTLQSRNYSVTKSSDTDPNLERVDFDADLKVNDKWTVNLFKMPSFAIMVTLSELKSIERQVTGT